MGFTRRFLRNIEAVSKKDDIDIYFIDNESGNLRKEDVDFKKLFESMPDNAVLFTFNLEIPRDLDYPNKASANFRSQVYGNLMSAIRYQQGLKK